MGIDETGLVIKVSGEKAWIRVENGEHCSTCASHSDCFQEDPSSSRQKIVEAFNLIDAKTGQKVLIHIKSADIVKASLIMYALPLLFLLIGALLGKMLGQNRGVEYSESWAVFLGLSFMGLSFLLIKFFDKLSLKRKNFYPEIIKVVD